MPQNTPQNTHNGGTQTPQAENYLNTLLTRLELLSKEVESISAQQEISAILEMIESAGALKKAEIEALAKKFALPYTKKSWRLLKEVKLYRMVMVQEVYKNKEGEIVKYGDILTRGANTANNAGTPRGALARFSRVHLPEDVEFIEVFGGIHTFFALPKEGKSLYAWGANYYGSAGAGHTEQLPLPVKIDFGARVKSVKTGWVNSNSMTTLVLCENGKVYSSGYNGYGGIGLGDTTDRNTFSEIKALKDIEKIEVASNGSRSSCFAIDKEGVLFAWGENSWGQLGIGNTTHQNKPQKITLNQKVTGVFGAIRNDGATSFIILEDGSLLGAGYNGHKNLSDTSTQNRPAWTPCKSAGKELKNIAKIYPASAYGTVFALDFDKNLYAWGYGTQGFGDKSPNATPTEAKIVLEGVLDFSCYTDNLVRAYALKKDGLYAFGRNSGGMLGIGNTIDTGTFTPLRTKPDDFVCYAYAEEGNLLTLRDDCLYACGNAENGTLDFASATLQRVAG